MNNFTITNENIETATQTVAEFLEKNKAEKKDILRTKLALEDTLINYRDTLGEETVCNIKCVSRFGRLRVELSVNGEMFDVFASADEDGFSVKLMAGIGMAPVWQYKNGQNIVIFTPKKKKPSQMVYIAAAIVMAVVLGILTRFLPETAQTFITDTVLTPVFDTFLGLLNGVASIMIFLSVVWGICSIGDMSALSVIGKKMISRMLMMMVIIPSVFTACILPLFSFASGDDSGGVKISGLFDMLLGIIPTNMITPFVEGSFLQIVFIGVMVGIAILVLGNKTSVITSFIEQANVLIQLILEFICSFVCVVIFISLYNMVVTGGFTVIIEVYKAPLLVLAGCIFAMAVYTVAVCVTQKVKPTVFLKKVMPAFLISLTTASSSAALSTTMETCKKQYGIDSKIINFGVPLGRIVLGLGSVVEFIVLGFCMAEIYGVSISPVWIVMAVLTSIILKIATPPIPGGSAALCTILFNQLGLPLEGLAVAVAIDVIADFLITATDNFCIQSELVILSGKLNMLDTDKLRRKI